MAKGNADTDLLMYFVQSASSDPIKAESTGDLADSDKALMGGFVAGQFFEAADFSFSIKLADDEGGSRASTGDSRSFARWRALTDTASTPEPPFRAEPDEVTINRSIDASSPVLLQYCLDTKPFETVVMVKRARRGRNGQMAVLLRMEFSKVWIRSISWDDGDTVTETCKFKFMSVNATYAKFKPSGEPDSTVNCKWSAK